MPFLNDLFWVGPSKPLGYLPISTIKDEGKSVRDIMEWAGNVGIRCVAFTEFESRVSSGAVYVWHESALQALLDSNRDILTRTEWPIIANDFVSQVVTENARDPALYELIGVAFNDFRFRDKREHTHAPGQT
jgi:hypothetical protein